MSKGYQRLFADATGHVLLRSRDGALEKPISVTDAFVESNFNTYVVDAKPFVDLEDEWARIESTILPAVRSLVAGDEQDLHRDAVRVLAAIHFARSYGFDVTHDRILAEGRQNAPAEMAADPDVHAAWRADRGVDPKPGEIEKMASDAYAALVRDGRFRAERMVAMYEKTLERLRELHVQLVRHPSKRRPPSVPLIYGDTPVVHWKGLQTGLKDGLAFMDADHVWFPLAPTLAAMFTTTDEGDQLIPSMVDVQRLNHRVWRASWGFVAGHPSTDMPRALALG